MILTEAQAKKRACLLPCGDPNATVPVCSASFCMAWRWFDTVNDDGTKCTPVPTPHIARSPDKERPLVERRGFCGLAGKP